MTARGATLAGRRAAEHLMVDACTISAETAPQYDVETDQQVTPVGALRYTGRCRIRPRDNSERVLEAGGQTVALWPYLVSVPMSATGIDLGDVVHIDSCELDPSLVGLVLRVRQVLAGTHLTARRIGCEVQSS